jgi:hypothetical protein
LKKGNLGGFQVLIKIPPDPPLGKGGKKTCLSDVTLNYETDHYCSVPEISYKSSQQLFPLPWWEGVRGRGRLI